eukprot:188689-Prorocentrum_minimum.AAC.2
MGCIQNAALRSADWPQVLAERVRAGGDGAQLRAVCARAPPQDPHAHRHPHHLHLRCAPCAKVGLCMT